MNVSRFLFLFFNNTHSLNRPDHNIELLIQKIYPNLDRFLENEQTKIDSSNKDRSNAFSDACQVGMKNQLRKKLVLEFSKDPTVSSKSGSALVAQIKGTLNCASSTPIVEKGGLSGVDGDGVSIFVLLLEFCAKFLTLSVTFLGTVNQA